MESYPALGWCWGHLAVGSWPQPPYKWMCTGKEWAWSRMPADHRCRGCTLRSRCHSMKPTAPRMFPQLMGHCWRHRGHGPYSTRPPWRCSRRRLRRRTPGARSPCSGGGRGSFRRTMTRSLHRPSSGRAQQCAARLRRRRRRTGRTDPQRCPEGCCCRSRPPERRRWLSRTSRSHRPWPRSRRTSTPSSARSCFRSNRRTAVTACSRR